MLSDIADAGTLLAIWTLGNWTSKGITALQMDEGSWFAGGNVASKRLSRVRQGVFDLEHMLSIASRASCESLVVCATGERLR